MIKVTFFKRDGVYYGFKETGHAGFDDAGKDIVCAAVSAMTMLVINAIEVSYESNVEYSIDEDTADIEVRVPSALPENSDDETKRFAVSGLIEAYSLQLIDMLEDYDEYLDVNEVED
ncbi:MAG: ribosomal-processing cysteine protease Prp [Clostridia bacterium]|nr:ribosomal-processing cysteine protease Prp [Clostridia bacterium]